jgi:hypothetical protein
LTAAVNRKLKGRKERIFPNNPSSSKTAFLLLLLVELVVLLLVVIISWACSLGRVMCTIEEKEFGSAKHRSEVKIITQ